MVGTVLDQLPGFRRRFLLRPSTGQITAAVEDDYHCMAVTLQHDGVRVTQVEALLHRAPWTTCPGAKAKLKSTFEGFELKEITAREQKQSNCTHLHDLAVLAADHAADSSLIQYDILVCDPMDGIITAEIRRDGRCIHRITHRDDIVMTPPEIAGISLFKLRGWIESLDGVEREAARLLQWGAILAHGRTTPMERQSDASRMPPNCFTFQPENAVNAVRIGTIFDFSISATDTAPPVPLDHFNGTGFDSETRPT